MTIINASQSLMQKCRSNPSEGSKIVLLTSKGAKTYNPTFLVELLFSIMAKGNSFS